LKPKSHIATNVTVDKHLPISPDISPPAILDTAIENNRSDKEWTESRIYLRDLHQHYLKLSKSRLTSKNIYCTILCY